MSEPSCAMASPCAADELPCAIAVSKSKRRKLLSINVAIRKSADATRQLKRDCPFLHGDMAPHVPPDEALL
eukprot:4915995-Karenia_brevis.AAC.1